MSKEILQDTQIRMDKTIHALEENLKKFRAGRAHPSFLDKIMVSYYGNNTPLSQIASIGVESALMLTVKPWEKQLTSTIEKAIRTCDLGLNPATSGDVIRVPLPPLSEERRKELSKKVKTECDDAKVAIRNIRRDANGDVKNALKDKKMSEDDAKSTEEAIQKITDKSITQIDTIFEHKQKDLLAI